MHLGRPWFRALTEALPFGLALLLLPVFRLAEELNVSGVLALYRLQFVVLGRVGDESVGWSVQSAAIQHWRGRVVQHGGF